MDTGILNYKTVVLESSSTLTTPSNLKVLKLDAKKIVSGSGVPTIGKGHSLSQAIYGESGLHGTRCSSDTEGRPGHD